MIDYIEMKNYSAAGRKNGVSASTVRRAVSENKQLYTVLCDKLGEKRFSIEKYLKGKREMIMEIAEKCLDILNDDDKLRSATVPQLTSAVATIMEKLLPEEESEQEYSSDPLSESLMELAEGLRSDK